MTQRRSARTWLGRSCWQLPKPIDLHDLVKASFHDSYFLEGLHIVAAMIIELPGAARGGRVTSPYHRYVLRSNGASTGHRATGSRQSGIEAEKRAIADLT